MEFAAAWGLDIEALREYSSGILVMLITAMLLAALIPLARNFGASTKIYLMNKAKGKPTFKPGTVFDWIALPSGFEIGPSVIVKVDYFTVTLREQETNCIVTLPKVVFGPCPKGIANQTEAIESSDNKG